MSYKGGLNVTSESGSGFERLRTDVAQTSFFEGREFRTFLELNLANGATQVVKAVVPKDTILHYLQLTLDSGFVRLYTKVGGVEGGSFSTSLPIFGTNNMSEAKDHRRNKSGVIYTPEVLLTTGGTHTGGAILDVVRIKTAGNSNMASSVGGEGTAERGIAPGTYYFLLENLDANAGATGVFRATWEERGNGFFST